MTARERQVRAESSGEGCAADRAPAHRLGRLDTPRLSEAVAALENPVNELDHVEIGEENVRAAGDITEADALRGYGAVHLAAAVAIAAGDVVVVTGDGALPAAASPRRPVV